MPIQIFNLPSQRDLNTFEEEDDENVQLVLLNPPDIQISEEFQIKPVPTV